MKTDREIMQQALEVMELLSQQPIKIALDFVDNAIAALRERLAHCDRCGKPLSGDGDIHTCSPQMRENETVYAQPEQNWIDELVKVPDHVWAQREQEQEQEQESVRDLLISAAAMAVVMLRNGTYKRASDVADAVLDREVVPQPDTKVNLQAIPKQISEPVFDCPRCGHCCPQPEQEPVAFEEWLSKQHGDPEEIGFLQALRIAYISGQDSITTPQPNHIVGANKMVPQEPPPWWPAVENILTEYGLQAIDFVADFKKALAQSEQEPAMCRVCGDDRGCWAWQCNHCGAFDESPQPRNPRQWQGLTDQDREEVFNSLPNGLEGFMRLWGWLHFAKGIEAKLKEKNT